MGMGVAGIINSYCGSFPHSLRLAPVTGWWFQPWLLFSIIYGTTFPIDKVIFFKMVIAPPTRYPLVNIHKKLWNITIFNG